MKNMFGLNSQVSSLKAWHLGLIIFAVFAVASTVVMFVQKKSPAIADKMKGKKVDVAADKDPTNQVDNETGRHAVAWKAGGGY